MTWRHDDILVVNDDSNHRKGNKMDLIKKLEEFRAHEQALSWEGTFADYFEVVKANPHVSQLAHARIFDMIMSVGVEQGKGGIPRYLFFDGEIYGLEKSLQQV